VATCKATREDGGACQARPLRGCDFCFWHDPASRGDMLNAASRGGSRRAVELPERESLTPEATRSILAALLEALLSGAVASGTARAAGYLVQVDLQVRSALELERRLQALERALQHMPPGGRET